MLGSVRTGRALRNFSTSRALTRHAVQRRAVATVAGTTGDSADSAGGRPPTAVVLFNLGGPASTTEVEPFLFRLFSDPDLIPIPFQSRMAPWIARRRAPKIAKQYAAIGGGSPIRKWTELQGELLCAELDARCPESAPHKPYLAFRYATPLTDDAVAAMKRDGVRRAIGFTQYPQYSCSTTGSSMNELHRVLRQEDPQGEIEWSFIDRWPTHKGLVKSFARLIADKLTASYPVDDRDNVTLLFSAHSLPMSVVNRGDPYPQEVGATVQAVMEELGMRNPYRLVWQSQVGPAPWLGPRTDIALEGMAKNGIKNVMLIPIAFTSDHIETLFELDLEYGAHAKELGITGLTRCDSLNDHPLFITALADLVQAHLMKVRAAEDEDTDVAVDTGLVHGASPQMWMRCPACSKDSCGKWRMFFKERAEAQELERDRLEEAKRSAKLIDYSS